MRMLKYGGQDSWTSVNTESAVLAVVKLDLDEPEFMVGLLADLEVAKGSLSVKTNILISQDIYQP